MKVRIVTDQNTTEPQLIVRVPPNYPQRDQLLAALRKFSLTPATLAVSQHGQTVALPLTAILFIEATGHQVAVHTAATVYQVNRSLTAIAETLPGNFQRVSKSAVVNIDQIYSLTKTLTGNLLAFQASPKQLYVSRRYYRPLKLILEKESFL